MKRYIPITIFHGLLVLVILTGMKNGFCRAGTTGTSPILRNISGVRGVEGEDVIYACADSGVLRSDDRCVTWDAVAVPGAGGKAMDMELAGGTPVVNVAGGIYIVNSMAGEPLFVSLGDDFRVVGGKYRPTAGREDIFLFDRGSLYALHDRDVEPVDSLPGSGPVHRVVLSGNTFYALAGREVFISIDKGASWRKITAIRPDPGFPDDGAELTEDDEVETVGPDRVSLRGAGDGTASLIDGSRVLIFDGPGVLERVEMTGLPSSGLNSAVYRKGELFAATGRRVFRYSFEKSVWRLFCEPSGAGDIKDMDIHLFAEGEYRLILATENNIICMPLYNTAGREERTWSESMGKWSVMPSISEVQRMAVEYAEVAPDKIRKWRKGARWKGLLPRLSVRFSESVDDNIDIYKNSSTSYVIRGPRERDNDWSVDMTWDLSDLIWNAEQTSIDVRSKLMVQLREDILEEVTRLYFQRKKLVLEIMDEGVDRERSLRVRELTAYIDALTGGAFSEAATAEGAK
ncbi:MAG: hypothetical protein GF392_03275 [Candidatus Omnitrophica bacterium]|nr:hypothetical protein [Candidatus Omnitrophota bacterium]